MGETTRMATGISGKISVLSAQFCCVPTTALKEKGTFKKCIIHTKADISAINSI